MSSLLIGIGQEFASDGDTDGSFTDQLATPLDTAGGCLVDLSNFLERPRPAC